MNAKNNQCFLTESSKSPDSIANIRLNMFKQRILRRTLGKNMFMKQVKRIQASPYLLIISICSQGSGFT